MVKQVKNTYIGAKLFEWQKAVTDEICNQRGSNKVVVCKAHRQAGKSYMCEGVLLHYALNYPNTISAMISPTLNQSRNVFKELISAIYESGVVKRKNETLLEIEMINGSRIFFRSSEMGEALRGYHINGILILDEASYLSEDIAQLVLPWRQVAKAPMLVVSTPKLKTGLFFRYYSMGIEKQDGIVTIDWNDYDTTPLLSKEQIETYRKILPRNQFKSEILGEFLDMEGMVFTNLENNIQDTTTFNSLYVGIDWGTGKGEDYTSMTMFNEKGEMVFLDYFNDLGTFLQVERLAHSLIKYKDKIKLIQAEDNSIGSPLSDLLEKLLNDKNERGLINKFKRFTTTNKSKSEIVAQVQTGLELNTLKLLNDKVLISQLTTYEATYNFKTGNVSYNGAQGTHDDLVISTMIAYDSYMRFNKQSTYSIGGANMTKRNSNKNDR